MQVVQHGGDGRLLAHARRREVAKKSGGAGAAPRVIFQLRETLRGLLEVRVAAQDVADLIDVVACLQARTAAAAEAGISLE